MGLTSRQDADVIDGKENERGMWSCTPLWAWVGIYINKKPGLCAATTNQIASRLLLVPFRKGMGAGDKSKLSVTHCLLMIQEPLGLGLAAGPCSWPGAWSQCPVFCCSGSPAACPHTYVVFLDGHRKGCARHSLRWPFQSFQPDSSLSSLLLFSRVCFGTDTYCLATPLPLMMLPESHLDQPLKPSAFQTHQHTKNREWSSLYQPSRPRLK